MEHSDSIQNIAVALCSVQKQLKPLKRNADNPFFKSNYTDLAAMTDAIYPLATEAGIAVVQGGDGSTLDTMLLHSSGEWIRTSLIMPAEPNPQKLGSVITYFRRYALAAAFGAVSEGEDDDGNAASHPPARASAPSPANRPPAESGARPTPPAPAAPAPGAGPASGFLTVLFVDESATATGGTRFSAKFSDGTRASTFDTKHGEALHRAKARNLPVTIQTEKKGNFTNLTFITVAGDTHDDTDGSDPDPDAGDR